MSKSIEEKILDLWTAPPPFTYAEVAIFIPKWSGRPYHQYGNRDDRGFIITTPRTKSTQLKFENGETRYYNDLTFATHTRILEMEKIIEEGSFAECLTSPYSYVREYKKWLEESK